MQRIAMSMMALMTTASSVLAHPGHGGDGMLHYLTSLEHTGFLALLGVAVAAAVALTLPRLFSAKRS